MKNDIDTKNTFKPGVYEAELKEPARIKTKITIDQNGISDVQIRSLKGERPIEPDLEQVFRGQIIKAQSVKIDGVSSASVLTKAVKSVVGEAIAEARQD